MVVGNQPSHHLNAAQLGAWIPGRAVTSIATLGSLQCPPHAPQRNVSTSGLSGMTRRPPGDAHAGQIAGKIMHVKYAEVREQRVSVNVLQHG